MECPTRAPTAIVVALGAAVVARFSPQGYRIQVVGPVPVGLLVPAVPDVSATDLAALILPAFGSIIAQVDNVLTAKAFGDRSANRWTPTRSGALSVAPTSRQDSGTASR